MHNHCMSAAFRAWVAFARDRRNSSDMFARAIIYFQSSCLQTAFTWWRTYAHEHAQDRRKLALAIACFQHSLLLATWRAWKQVCSPWLCAMHLGTLLRPVSCLGALALEERRATC